MNKKQKPIQEESEISLKELAQAMQDQPDEPDFVDTWRDNIDNYLIVESISGDMEECIIYEKDTKCILLIEDDDEAMKITQEMIGAGIPVVKDIPHE